MSELTSELYETIVRIVDDRLKEIKVTREDFDTLGKDIATHIASLTQAQQNTEAIVQKFTEAQARTEATVQKLTEAQARTEATVQKLTEAQARTEARVGELAEAQTRTEARVGELAEAQARTERAVQDLTKAVGGLSDNVGFGLEDLGRTLVPGWLERHVNIDVGFLERKFFEIEGEEKEINLFGEGSRDGKKIILLGESKSRMYRADVSKFAKDAETVEKNLSAPVFKFMFGYFVHPSAREEAAKYDISLIVSYER